MTTIPVEVDAETVQKLLMFGFVEEVEGEIFTTKRGNAWLRRLLWKVMQPV
jgi:hypothetical protein